jgi:hypothetical protein
MSLLVNRNGSLNGSERLQGLGGRSYVVSASSSAAIPVVKVQEEHFNPAQKPFTESAVVENLIIDGKGYDNTGILLENVCNCQVRNVTIRNCEVGIHIRNYDGLWSETNCLKHIRMENVAKGIVFTTTGPRPKYEELCPGDSAGFTVIEDVGIELADNVSDAVGIQVGGTRLSGDVTNTRVAPYSGRIRANVRLGTNGGTGLKILNGELGYVQAHLTVHNVHNSPNGVGIDLQGFDPTTLQKYKPAFDYRPVWQNQFTKIVNNNVVNKGFMLVTSNITLANAIRLPKNTSKPSFSETDIAHIATTAF